VAQHVKLTALNISTLRAQPGKILLLYMSNVQNNRIKYTKNVALTGSGTKTCEVTHDGPFECHTMLFFLLLF